MKENPDQLKGKLPAFLVPQKYPEGEMSGAVDYEDGLDVQSAHARENPEPVLGGAPASSAAGTFPVWLIALIAIALFWAGGYLFLFSGAFRGDVYNERNWSVAMMFPAAAGAAGEEAAAEEDPVALGKRFYTQNCVTCHQSSGGGVPGQYPPLVGTDWVLGSDKRLIGILLNGLQGPLNVEGQVYNNAMPAWSAKPDKQIAYILTYIRNEWGNKAAPITPEMVAAGRAEFGGRTEPWTEAELLQIPADSSYAGEATAPAQP